MGFPKSASNLDSWYSQFRHEHDTGTLDIIFIQETHVNNSEIQEIQLGYQRSWGFQDLAKRSAADLSL
jgi:hypothetical protein